MAGVFLECSSSYILRQVLSLELIGVHTYDWSSGSACPGDPVFVSGALGTKTQPVIPANQALSLLSRLSRPTHDFFFF